MITPFHPIASQIKTETRQTKLRNRHRRKQAKTTQTRREDKHNSLDKRQFISTHTPTAYTWLTVQVRVVPLPEWLAARALPGGSELSSSNLSLEFLTHVTGGSMNQVSMPLWCPYRIVDATNNNNHHGNITCNPEDN